MKKEESGFAKGMLCGVMMVFVSLGALLGWKYWQLERTIKERAAMRQETESEEEISLTLDKKRIGQKISEIESLINRYYYEDANELLVEDAICRGMVSGLEDPYSVYYDEEDLSELQEAATGIYPGIGALLTQNRDTGVIMVVRCYEGTPSYEAGLQPGDVLCSINGEKVDGVELSELVRRIKTDENRQILMQVLRNGEELELEMERREVELPTVDWEMLDGNIGYLRILEFDGVTPEQFRRAIEALLNEGMEKLILDVRDNPGGILNAVCEVLDEILPEGLIVYIEDKYGNREEHFSDEEHQMNMPMAVLMNENSASASEIFAGALKDYEKATLIGTTTFGKGVVQRPFTLSDGTGLKLTIAKYYTPKGNDIHEKGVEPDVKVEWQAQETENSKIRDNQLLRAIEILDGTETNTDTEK